MDATPRSTPKLQHQIISILPSLFHSSHAPPCVQSPPDPSLPTPLRTTRTPVPLFCLIVLFFFDRVLLPSLICLYCISPALPDTSISLSPPFFLHPEPAPPITPLARKKAPCCCLLSTSSELVNVVWAKGGGEEVEEEGERRGAVGEGREQSGVWLEPRGEQLGTANRE